MAGDLLLKVKFAGIDGLSRVLDGIGGATKRAGRQLAETNRTLRAQKTELRDVQRQMAAGSGNLTTLINRERQLEHAIEQGNRELGRRKTALERASRAERFATRWNGRADRLASGGQRMIAAGAIGGAGIGLATREAAEFGSVLVDIAQKADMPIARVRQLGKEMIRVATITNQLPTDIEAAADTLLGFGANARDTMQMLRPIGQAATAYKADAKDLAAASYALVSNLGVAARDTGAALDAMAVAGKAGKVELKDMAAAFPSLASGAAALGARGVPAAADLAAALEIVAGASGDASEAANNLQNLLAKAAAPETIKNFKKVGIDLPAALKRAVREGRSPIEELVRLTQKVTGGDAFKIGELFSDMQVQGALRPLMAQMNEYTALRGRAAAGRGTVATDFNFRQANDPSAQMRKAKVEMQKFAIVFGTQLLPYLTIGAEKLGNFLTGLSGFAEAHPGLAQFAGFLTILLTGLGALAQPLSWLMRSLPMIRTFGSGIMWIVRIAGMAVTAIAGVLGAPVWVVAAIGAALVAAGVLIYKYWDQIKAGFGAAWQWLVGFGKRMGQIGVMIVKGIINGIGSMFGALKNKIVGLGKGAVGWFKGVLGIHSPSRVFAGLGGHMMSGLGVGIDRGARHPLARIRAAGAGLAAAAAVTIMPAGAPAAAATAGRGAAPVTNNYFTIQLPAGAGADVRAMAKALMAELKRLQEHDGASSYRDDD